ncbi:hypothetical protein PT974_04495 [Cladobotryum mycophilum]|uniref:2EXR domain-containing protein n=1 Tax=Cladobotryum mycophilum TaxID=491253 RepID=A0ABR0SV89_9HYPO
MATFSHLPLELRSLIWTFTIEPCRTVEVRFKHGLIPDGSGRPPGRWSALYATSPTPVPAALHTCREARSVIAHKYERAFTDGAEPRYVWVNFDLDIISIDKSYFASVKPEAPRIRRLKFAREMSEYYFYDERYELEMFSNLLELIVVRHDPELLWDDPNEEVYWPNLPEAISRRDPDEMCKTIAVQTNDDYGSLASKYGLNPNDPTNVNDKPKFYSTLVEGQLVCAAVAASIMICVLGPIPTDPALRIKEIVKGLAPENTVRIAYFELQNKNW